MGVAGDREAGGSGANPDEDGWDTGSTGSAFWAGVVATGLVAGGLSRGGVAQAWSCKPLGGSGKSQGRGIKAAGMILRTRMKRYSVCMRSKEVRIAYQVAAHITPLPRSCTLIELNSKLMYCEKYRTKGRISRTPSYMTPKAVRTFIIVLEMDWTRCFGVSVYF